MVEQNKKIPGITWEEIVLEAMVALTGGKNDVVVPAEEMYRWIEGTQYLTEKGREPDETWGGGRYPSYRASLQLRWQRMVRDKLLVRVDTGSYRLTEAQIIVPAQLWQEMIQVNATVTQPTIKTTTTRRIQRNQKLRDLLVTYYASRCQICGTDKTHSIPLSIPDRYYVEVHHVAGLAETVYLQEQGKQLNLRVNGLENLTVLCPHHHAVMHHHYPVFTFDRNALLWRTEQGAEMTFRDLTPEHADLLRTASVA